MTDTETVTAEQVMADWRASECPRDPYDDLGVLVREVERLRGLVDDHERRSKQTLEHWHKFAPMYREVSLERNRLRDDLWQILADLGNALDSPPEHRVKVALLHTREALGIVDSMPAESA